MFHFGCCYFTTNGMILGISISQNTVSRNTYIPDGEFSITCVFPERKEINNVKLVLRLQIPTSNIVENNKVNEYARTNQKVVRWEKLQLLPK